MSRPIDRVLTASELRALQTRSDARGATRLAIHLTLLGCTGWLVAVTSGWSVLPAMAVFGVVQAALFAPAHETMHQTAFASRRANLVVGWLAACPSLLNAQFYTAYHLAHHRNTQVPGRDPELLAPDPATLRGYAVRVLGIAFWGQRMRVILDCWRGDLSSYLYVPPSAAPGVIASVRAMSLFVATIAAGSALLFGWATPLLFWVGPQVLGQIPLRAYLLAEHTGCTQDRNGLTNTRTTLTNGMVRLLMWDMPFHAEHHLYPGIPFHSLRAAHDLIRDRLGFVQPGYARWHAALVRHLAAR
jgi:fatty acid desaturase